MTTTFRAITFFIVVFGPAILIAYDVVARAIGGREATITALIQEWAMKWHELPGISAAIFVWLWLHLYLNGLIHWWAEANQKP